MEAKAKCLIHMFQGCNLGYNIHSTRWNEQQRNKNKNHRTNEPITDRQKNCCRLFGSPDNTLLDLRLHVYNTLSLSIAYCLRSYTLFLCFAEASHHSHSLTPLLAFSDLFSLFCLFCFHLLSQCNTNDRSIAAANGDAETTS